MQHVLPIVLVTLACRSGTVPDIEEAPTPTGLPSTAAPPWQLEGQVGSLEVIRVRPGLGVPQSLQVHAVFADELPPGPLPATCAVQGRSCAAPDASESRQFDSPNPTVGAVWVGDRIDLGTWSPAFRSTLDEAGATGGYQAELLLDGSVAPRVEASVTGGEWGDATFPVDLPALPVGMQPSPEQELVVGDGGLTEIRWTPGGGPLVLDVRGADFGYTRWIRDDGSVWVDARDWRRDRPVSVRLTQTIRERPVDVNGNTLWVREAAQVAWCVTDSCPSDPFPLFPADLDFEFCWSPNSCNGSTWRLLADGTWRNGNSSGTWEWNCCETSLTLSFPSGTRYTANRSDDGCFEGEMVSFSGSRGEWRTCSL